MARRVLFLASFAAAAADDHSVSLPRRTTDTNLVTDDAGNEGGRHDYDKHGCDVAEGTYWCAIKNRCVTTWETCESLIGYNDQCTAMWSGLSWDLSALKGQVFTITDAVNTNPSYAYAFSVCGNVDLDKTGFTDSLKRTCGSTTGTAGETMTDPSPVYQVVDGTMCKRAGVDQSGSNKDRFIRGNQMEWGLLDPLNPAMGLELTYTGGNTCKENQFQAAGSCDYKGSDGKSYCERGMKIRMVCNPSAEYIPLVNSVTEDASCMYELRVNSKYACPTQCPMGSNGKVCSGKGICMYSGYSDDDYGEPEALKGTATASCACKSGNYDQDHTGADCGTYSRWGSTYTEEYYYLNQRAEFWRRLWAILFVAITTTVCVAQRDRLVPIYTGIRSLYNGGSGGGEAGVTYQRVATDTHVKGQGKFAVADLEDEYDDAAFGDSAAL